MPTRDTIDDLERQLEEAKRDYLRSHGWDVTFKTPGSMPLWFRSFETGMIATDMNLAVHMTLTAIDPDNTPDADSSE